MLFGVGSLAALFALWVGVLTYGIRPSVSTFGIGQLMSLIALPPLGVWGVSTATVLWRKQQTARKNAAAADAEQAECARQAALAEAARTRELAARQRSLRVRMLAVADTPANDSASGELGVAARCQALAQTVLDEVRAVNPQMTTLPVLAQMPADAVVLMQGAMRGMECFDQPAELLIAAFQRLDTDPGVPGVILLAVDAPRALLETAPTRFNAETLQEEPDLDLPLRGEAGQMAVALYVSRDEDDALEAEGPTLATLHQPGGAGEPVSIAAAITTAAANGKLLPAAGQDEFASAPGRLFHTAGSHKAGGALLAKLAMNLPEFSPELDVVDDALNVPRELGDFGEATFWVGVAKAIEYVNQQGVPAMCIDCCSAERMAAVVIHPPAISGAV